jgi:hypothetical protein
MSLLEEFALNWGLKVDRDRIPGLYGFIIEHQEQLWVWTHSYSPNGHEFFPIINWATELNAVVRIKSGLLIDIENKD